MVSAIVILFVVWALSGWAVYYWTGRYAKRIIWQQIERENSVVAMMSEGTQELRGRVSALEFQNKARAEEIMILTERLARVDNTAANALDLASDSFERINKLTDEPEKPKITPKQPLPKRVNWTQARAALEKRDDPQEE